MEFWKKPLFGLPLWMAVGLFFASILCQVATFGHPFTGIDQEYYLYGGGQLLQGKVLYVDFWDRKSPGLFLLFAFFHLFGAWRFWAVPIFAAIFIWIGALYVARISITARNSRDFTALSAAFISSLIFIESFAWFKAVGGQAEDYYVPLMSVAFGLVIINWDKIFKDYHCLFKVGSKAMGVMGIALFLKSSCVWEGLLLGVCLLAAVFNTPLLNLKRKTLLAFLFGLVWVALAILPIAAGACWYLYHNLGHEWFFANFTSYHLKIAFPDNTVYHRFIKRCLQLTIGLFCLSFMFLRSHIALTPSNKNLVRFLWLWVAVTFWEVLSVKGWHSYSLCCISPAVGIILSSCWEKVWAKILILLVLFKICFSGALYSYRLNASYDGQTLRQQYNETASLLKDHPGCLASISSYFLIYDLVPSCNLTKYAFPTHFTDISERPSLGADAFLEAKKVIEQRPLYILYAPSIAMQTPDVAGYVDSEIKKNYVLIKTLKDDEERYTSYLYKLKPGIAPLSLPNDAHKAP